MTMNDKRTPDSVKYQLKNFNFFATQILVNEQSGRKQGWFFDYGDVGFEVHDFDNFLPGKQYRLAIEQVAFSTQKGVLELQNSRLMPQDTLFQRAETQAHLSMPLLRIAGLRRMTTLPPTQLHFSSLLIAQPEVSLSKKDGTEQSVAFSHIAIDEVAWNRTLFHIGNIELASPVANIHAMRTQETAQPRPKTPQKHTPIASPETLYNPLPTIASPLSIGRFALSHAGAS